MLAKPAALFLFTCLRIAGCSGQTPQEINWLKKQAKPVESVNPDHSSGDLEPFRRIVNPARLVGLGECTHGSHEVFQMKHRLIKDLVEQSGFTIFAIESDFAGAQIVNEYVQSGKGDSLQVVEALVHWPWSTDEVWQMIKWMKTYNQDNAKKIAFTGFDMNVPFPAIQAIRQFSIEQASLPLKQWVDQLDTLYRRKTPLPANLKQHCRRLSKKISKALNEQKASPARQQCGRILVQYAALESKRFFNRSGFRDKCMAANTDWILQQNPAAKVILWAHNGHVEKRHGLSRSMGHYLAKTYGADYVSVGFTTAKGTYTALTIDPVTKRRRLSRTNRLQEPVPDSFETYFEASGLTDFYLDLRTLPANQGATAWLRQKKWMRSIGSTVPARPDYQFSPNHQLNELYDVVIHLNQTSASHSYLVK